MPRTINGIKFYTVEETAQLLQISKQTIRNYLKRGMLRGQRIGQPVYITEKSIQDFLKPSMGEDLVHEKV